jgi:hypothetical protein
MVTQQASTTARHRASRRRPSIRTIAAMITALAATAVLTTLLVAAMPP